MKTVWKFQKTLESIHSDMVSFSMPTDSKVLSAQNQGNRLTLWVETDLDKPEVDRYFLVSGTGQAIKENIKLRFINTVQFFDGSLVLHVFEVIE